MPRRPPTHVLEQAAAAALTATFGELGWTIEPITQDYGEDFLVRVFDSGVATPWTFFVQSKAVQDANRLLVDSGTAFSLTISNSHLQQWQAFALPVFVTLFDASSRTLYWEHVQEADNAKVEECATRTVRFRIPADQALSRASMPVLRHITRARHERNAAQVRAIHEFCEVIEKQWGVKLSVGTEPGVVVLPNGKFQPAPDGGKTIFVLGVWADLLRKIALRMGASPQEAMSHAIQFLYDEFREGRNLVANASHGTVAREIAKRWAARREPNIAAPMSAASSQRTRRSARRKRNRTVLR